MIRSITFAGAVAAVFAVAGCGDARPLPASHRSVPDVVGENLEDAEELLEERGFQVQAVSVDGDPILVESFWTICDQSPAGGGRGRTVELYAAHNLTGCDDDSSW